MLALETSAPLGSEKAQTRRHVVAVGQRQVWPVRAEHDLLERGDLGRRLDCDLVVAEPVS